MPRLSLPPDSRIRHTDITRRNGSAPLEVPEVRAHMDGQARRLRAGKKEESK